MSTTLIGKEHNAHLDWLLNTWMNSSSPVCFLEGFPGTGKTAIARELLAKSVEASLPAVMITSPETEKDPTDDLLLDLAMELNSAGKNELARAIENNRPLLDVLSTLVNEPILIIIDEFQRSMQAERAITSGGFAKVLSSLANRKWLKGRILLLTNRLVERARWSEPYAIRTLNGMSPEDGVELLDFFAQEGKRIEDIAPERRTEIVKWLGGNPRAMRLLVRNLAYESLEDLIGIQPELWEMRDRKVSEELVEDLERHLLEKTLNQFPENYLLQLNRLAVLRKPFKRQAMELLFSEKSVYAQFKEEMIDRFLMEQHKGWFSLHPIVREIGLQKLAKSSADVQQAHSIVSQYYTRHFEAKQIVGWGALGGHFVEARYHLVKAGKSDDLKNIASRFQSYIFSTLSEVSPIPHNAEELDERIAVLSALLETPGPKSLEYHLARLLLVRNQRNDFRRALQHADRAIFKSDYEPAWLLNSEILVQMDRHDEAITVLKQGIDRIPPDKALANIYDRLAQLLAEKDRHDEAITVLKQGIDRIPPDKSITDLYNRLAQLLAEKDRYDEAITVLKQGIDRIPPDKNLRVIYDRLAQLLAEKDRHDEAIMVLKQGIDRIPPDKSITDLYNRLAQLLAEKDRYDEAIKVLKQGIDRIPPDKNLFYLYNRHAQVLSKMDRHDEAIAVLDGGINRIPSDKGLVYLYNTYIELLSQTHRYEEAIAVLEEGIKRTPPKESDSLKSRLNLITQMKENNMETRMGKEAINTGENYVDFDLHIASDGHILANSPEGQATAHISTQLPSNIRLSLQLIERQQTDTNLLKEIGISLYDWLFPNSIHTHFQLTEAVAKRDNAKLRLRMRVESAPIASLPLEFIYRESGGYFMAVNPDTVLSRYLNLPVPPERVRRRESPLHMLVIIADPTDQVRLNPDEWESIVQEAIAKPLTDGQVTFKTVKRATRKEIRNALLEQKPDIIQFVGHGVYKNGKGYLALVDENTDKTWLVDDERFANLFMGYDDHLGLVTMATCESAQSDDPQSFLGIAPQLVQRGTPAVIAMQYSVYIKTAKVFLDELYTAIAARKPVDWAVQSARNGVSLEFGLDNREFATPVLYMRAKDGNVF